MTGSILKLVQVPLIIVLVAGCELLPSDGELPTEELSDIYKIVWTLESSETTSTAHVGDRQVPHLVFDTTTFFGDDGCRKFYASYTATDNHVVPGELVIETAGCEGGTVSGPNFAEPFDVEIRQGELKVAATNGRFDYYSHHIEPVAGSPLVGETWTLVSSDDPEVQALDSEFVPALVFDAEREYAITWRCVEDNVFGCNKFSGLWGVGGDDRILLYETGAQVSNAQHSQVIRKLQQVSSYRLEAGDLILISDTGSVEHRFVKQ